MSVTVIKDLGKAVAEQEAHRKALRENKASAGETKEDRPQAPEAGSAQDSSKSDSPNSET